MELADIMFGGGVAHRGSAGKEENLDDPSPLLVGGRARLKIVSDITPSHHKRSSNIV